MKLLTKTTLIATVAWFLTIGVHPAEAGCRNNGKKITCGTFKNTIDRHHRMRYQKLSKTKRAEIRNKSDKEVLIKTTFLREGIEGGKLTNAIETLFPMREETVSQKSLAPGATMYSKSYGIYRGIVEAYRGFKGTNASWLDFECFVEGQHVKCKDFITAKETSY